MPNNLDEFNTLRVLIARAIFGEKPDKIIESINRFMLNFQNLKKASEESFFPMIFLNIIYWPMYVIVMLFNCIKEGLMWWIVATIIFAVFTAFLGLLCGLLFIAYRGFKIYDQRFDLSTGEPKKRDNGDENDQDAPDSNNMEGGEREPKQSSNGSSSAQFEGG